MRLKPSAHCITFVVSWMAEPNFCTRNWIVLVAAVWCVSVITVVLLTLLLIFLPVTAIIVACIDDSV